MEQYSGQWEMLAVSLWAVALYWDTDSGIPGFYQHAMLDFAYKTSEAVTKGVTDEEGAIRGRQRCLLFTRFLCFHLFVFGSCFLDTNYHICAIYICVVLICWAFCVFRIYFIVFVPFRATSSFRGTSVKLQEAIL